MSRYQKAQARSRLVQIKDVLRENPRGLTISEISRKIDVNRNSVAKYLDVLLISGQVEMRVLGPAKLFYLSQRVPISAMLNFSSDYILALENNLKIVQVNDNLLKLLNIKREAILGLGIEGFPHPIFTSQEIISKIDEAFEGKDSTVEGRSQVSGKEFYFSMKLIPSTFEDGSPGVTLCMEDITKRKEAEWALRERVKELGCLFGISRLVEGSDRDLESILERVVSLSPPAWQYPDITCARIVFDEQIFESDNFKETDWKQSADIEVHGEKVGAVEVYYLEDMPESYEGPFLKEERDLIDAIAERLGRIIERIQFEEMLRASEAMYSALVENTTDGIVIIQDDVLKFINTASVELVGYTPEELMGLEFINLVAPEHRETVMKRYSDRLEGIDVPSIYETSLLRKDGTTSPVEVNAALIDYEGRPADLVFIRDITERKKMEEDLLRGGAKNRALLNAIPDLMLNIDKDGTFLDLKPAKGFPTAVPPTEFLGKNIFEVMPKKFAQRVMHYVMMALQTEDIQIFEYQLPVPLQSQNMRDYEARIVASGKDEVVAIVRDITERKRIR